MMSSIKNIKGISLIQVCGTCCLTMHYPSARAFLPLRGVGQGLLEHNANFKYQAESHAAAITKLSNDLYSIFTMSSLCCSICQSTYSYSPVTKIQLLAVSDEGK